MNRKRLLVGIVLAGALLWVSYGAYVFNLEALASNQETIVMAAETASAGGQVSAHVVVRDHASGQRLGDSNVTVYLARNGTRTPVDSGQTDANGSYTASFTAPDEQGSYDLLVAADSRVGSDSVQTSLAVSREYSILVDTDKPVYQPGQSMQIRGIVRDRAAGPVDDNATVTVTGPSGNRLYSRSLALDEYGMGETTFPLASVAETGRYRVQIEYDGETRTRTVTVKEYKTPQFDVQFRPDQSYYKPGDTLHATVVSEYFFGKPVSNATVTVEGTGYVGDFEQFANVTAAADSEGVATLEMELPEYFVGLPERSGKGLAVLNVSVTDGAGHTETITRKVPIAQQDLLVDAYTVGGKLVPGVENTVYVTAEYPDGTPAQATVELDGTSVETNRYGVATYRFTPEDAYDQRLALRGRAGDATGDRHVYFRVERGNRITLAVASATYQAGETVVGRAFVPNETGTVYVDLVSGKQTLLTKSVPVSGSHANFSLSLPTRVRGDVRVRAWAVFRNGRVGASARTVLVEPADAVNVSVSSGRSTYRPGENATLTVETRQNGTIVPSAVGIDVVDESVFAVEEENAGLAAVHYDLEEELQRPELFVHNYSTTDGTSARSESTDGETSVARKASLARMANDPGGVTTNSYHEKRERIDQRQAGFKQFNAYLLAFVLGLIPLGYAVIEGRRTGPRTYLRNFGVTLLWLVGLLVLVGTAIATAEFASPGAGFWTALLFACGLVGGGVSYVAYKIVDGSVTLREADNRFLLAATGLVTVAIVGAIAHPFSAFSAVGPGWLLVFGSIVLFPVAYGASTVHSNRRRVEIAVVLGLVVTIAFVPIGAAFTMGAGMHSASEETGEQASTLDYRGFSDDGSSNGQSGDDGGSGQSVTDVRQYFPETAASRTVITGSNGTTQTQVQMPDSITTWRVSSVASARSGALGTDRSSIRVFQPFFIKPDIPLAVTQNDTVTMPVSVFNYENTSTTVTVELRQADWYHAANDTKTVDLGANDVGSVSFTVTAEENGEYPLTVVATSVRSNGSQTTDAVRKPVTVDPYGREQSVARSGSLSGTTTASVDVPSNAVENSPKTVLRVYPGAFGQVVQGMDALLAKPTGCFEQTSSSLYPNVLALQYMEETGTANPEVRMRAERFIASGYQRILTFETSTQGGYSLFGDDPPNLLLTSYGLMEMSDMNEVYSVDPSTITEMQSFVRSRQNADGSWSGSGRLEYPLGVSGDEVSTTAYVTWSLAHSGASGSAVDDGARYVKGNLDVSAGNTRTLAVALSMLADAGKYPTLQQRIADELASRKVTSDGSVHWSESEDSSQGYHYGDKRVLTTALVTNAFLESDTNPNLVDGSLTWLVERKSGDGGWGSTQNTVMALKALVAAQQTGDDTPTGTLQVTHDGETVANQEITLKNRDEVQTFVLPAEAGTNDYAIDAPGDGDLYYELETSYHQPWPEGTSPEGNESLSMTVRYDRTNLTVDDTVDVSVDITNEGGRIGTALVDLGVPPGFSVEEESLRRLVDQGVISRYETGGRQIILYVEDLKGSVSLSYALRATTPVEAKTGSASVYDYYNDDREAVEAPITMHVQADGG